MTHMTRRRLINGLAMIVSALTALAGLFFLLWILGDVLIRGAAAVNWDFFTQLPAPPGMEGGGLANGIAGTGLMTLAATAMAVPLGVLAGTYLAEFGTGHMARLVRFVADILVSAPSIVVGVFVYLVMVRPMGHFSGWAGAVSLAVIMLPMVCRGTDEILKLVDPSMREAALALGAPHWRMMTGVVYRAAGAGIFTGIMLAVARVAGETAPLLFTALNSPYWLEGMNEPLANLTVAIFNYAMSPYEDWHRLAWGAALLITVSVLVANVTVRIFLHPRRR